MWARQLGLKDTSSITKILNGQRHPGSKLTQKLSDFFEFEHEESQYFEDLVRLQKHGNDPKLCIAIMERMEKLHPNAQMRIIDLSPFNLISHWYCLVIREMVRLESFKEDYEWISSKLNFKVTPKEVKKTINLLLSLIYFKEMTLENLALIIKAGFMREMISQAKQLSAITSKRLKMQKLLLDSSPLRSVSSRPLVLICLSKTCPKRKSL